MKRAEAETAGNDVRLFVCLFVFQVRFGMGNYAGEEWLADWSKANPMDPARVPKAGMAEFNRACKKLSHQEVKGQEETTLVSILIYFALALLIFLALFL